MGAKKFHQHRKRLSFISTLVLLAFLNLTIGCGYYKVITETDIPSEKYSEMEQNKKYMILHYQNKVWHLTDIKIEDSVMLVGKILTLPPEHSKYKETNPEKNNLYKKTRKNDESGVINEVHIYVSEINIDNNSNISVPIKSIEKIEIYKKNKTAIFFSWFFTSLALAAILTVIIFAIVYEDMGSFDMPSWGL